MNQIFEAKVKFDKELDNAEIKTVTESFVVEAMSFTEAEATITQQMIPYVGEGNEFTITALNKRSYEDVLPDNIGGFWYHIKVGYENLDEKSGEIKYNFELYLIQALDFKEVVKKTFDYLKDSVTDFKVDAIKETKILDTYLYQKD